jgi:hypothetical protein
MPRQAQASTTGLLLRQIRQLYAATETPCVACSLSVPAHTDDALMACALAARHLTTVQYQRRIQARNGTGEAR